MDFDFFSKVGGGQVFYRRVVERNPSLEFLYPSSGPDIRLPKGRLPPNAHPFPFDPRSDFLTLSPDEHWLEKYYSQQLVAVAAAVQGMTFHTVDIPSFFPVAHMVRPVLASHGVIAERIALGLVGWQTKSVRSGYTEASAETIAGLEMAENKSVEAADIRYTISHLEQAENARTNLPVCLIGMQDAIESFPLPALLPPGEGPPDLWYVGRLDGAKGPDLFIELVSLLPRHLYGRCFFSGPDNTWSETDRWSGHLLELARAKGVSASYEGVLSDADLRMRVYRGRNVLVVPSRTDAFNYVSLEAVLNGCPILLSERAGSLGFLRSEHPHLAPEAMDPDNLPQAEETLIRMLGNYPQVAAKARKSLLDKPFPLPREGFMEGVYDSPPVRSAAAERSASESTASLSAQLPLLRPAARDWQPTRPPCRAPRITIVIPTFGRPELLALQLCRLTRQTFDNLEVIVVDDGSVDAGGVGAAARAFPWVRFVRTANQGEASAVNHGIDLARGEFAGVLLVGDAYSPELLAVSVEMLDRNPDAIGTYPDWGTIDRSGYFFEANRLTNFDRMHMSRDHLPLSGPGALLRSAVLWQVRARDTSFRFLSEFDLWLRASACGPMLHIPRRLAYRDMQVPVITASERLQIAAEHIRIKDQFFSDRQEMGVR